jgi:hypothetical protein
MRNNCLIIILALALSGCATMAQPGGIFYNQAQQRKLDKAVKLLQEKNTSTAEELLTSICSEPAVKGVTDEALFRLSLLRLGPAQGRNGTIPAQYDLERLKKEYPSSSWAPMASSLTEFLKAHDKVRQEERMLKESNFSLTKDNRELRESNLAITKENRELHQRI